MDQKKLIFWVYVFPLFGLGPKYLKYLNNQKSIIKIGKDLLYFEPLKEFNQTPKILFQIAQAHLFIIFSFVIIMLIAFSSFSYGFSLISINIATGFAFIFITFAIALALIMIHFLLALTFGTKASNNLDFKIPIINNLASKVKTTRDLTKVIFLLLIIILPIGFSMITITHDNLKNTDLSNQMQYITTGWCEEDQILEDKINNCNSDSDSLTCFIELAIDNNESSICENLKYLSLKYSDTEQIVNICKNEVNSTLEEN